MNVVDDFGNTLAFIVRSMRLFDRNADSTSVFISNDGLAHLNIIICEGTWNRVNDSYPDRRVVFTDAIPGEDPVAAVPSLTKTDAAVTSEETTISSLFFQKIISGINNSFNNVGR